MKTSTSETVLIEGVEAKVALVIKPKLNVKYLWLVQNHKNIVFDLYLARGNIWKEMVSNN